MTTIIYKKLLGRYEIHKIDEGGGESIRIEFEEPIDGSIILCDTPYSIRCGVCNIKKSTLTDGELIPKLYTGTAVMNIEGFIISHGAVVRKSPDADATRRLCAVVDELFYRVRALEDSISDIQNKIERKIQF